MESQRREIQNQVEEKDNLLRHLESQHNNTQRHLEEKLNKAIYDQRRLQVIIDNNQRQKETEIYDRENRLQREFDNRMKQLEDKYANEIETIRQTHIESMRQLSLKHNDEMKRSVEFELSNYESSREQTNASSGIFLENALLKFYFNMI